MEPVPPPLAQGGRADQPPVRAAGRDHGPQPGPGARGAQLLGAGHREHGDPGHVRHRAAAAGLARSAPRWSHPLRLLHDRARGGVVGRDQHLDPHRDRRRRVRHQRPQVVVDRRPQPRLQGLHRHGRHQSRCRPPLPAEHGARPEGRPRGQRRPGHAGVRLHRRPPRRARRGGVRRRAGAPQQPSG